MNRNRISTIIITSLIIIFLFQTASATSFNLKVSGEKKFDVNFKVSQPEITFLSNAPLEDIRGSVNSESISGTVNLDPANIEDAKGSINIEVKGMETGIQKRNGHLQSKVWLDAESFPNITFKLLNLSAVKVASSDAAKGRASAEAMASGEITIHGKTKIINVEVTLTYIKESDQTKKRAPGDFLSVTGNFDVNLSDFGITGTQGLIGTKVGEVIKINLNLFFNSN